MPVASRFGRLALLFLAAAAGCSGDDTPPLGEVSGTVTLDGTPLVGAVVTFYPAEGGRQSIGLTDEAGGYELRYDLDTMGAKVGPHEVRVSTAAGEDGAPELVPPRYNADGFLSETVESGENLIDLPLESGGWAPRPEAAPRSDEA